jgi:uncharacterized membrane protein YphA (DoxX/SURF4 family)
MQNLKAVEWVLRIAVAGEFIGHGVFALQQKVGWLKYFEALGISADSAMTLMPLIGIMDLVLALLILVKPMRIAILWMAFWGLWTALIRWPFGPDPFWDFVERWANWGAPLALLFLYGWPKSARGWWSLKAKDATSDL